MSSRGSSRRPGHPHPHHHVAASSGSPQVSAAKVIVYKQPQAWRGKAGRSPDSQPAVGRVSGGRGDRPSQGGTRGATLAGAQILQSQISESASAGEVASAAGVIQFNKPEAARDRKTSERGPPPPAPSCISCSVRVPREAPALCPRPRASRSPRPGGRVSCGARHPRGRGLPKP